MPTSASRSQSIRYFATALSFQREAGARPIRQHRTTVLDAQAVRSAARRPSRRTRASGRWASRPAAARWLRASGASSSGCRARRPAPARLHPAADAADAARSGITRSQADGVERLQHGLRAVEVLADLQRQVERAGDLGVAAIVVVADRLFEPGHAFGLQRAPALERVDRRSAPGCSRPSGARCRAGACARRASRPGLRPGVA